MATPLPPNKSAFSLDEILAVTGGTLVRRGEKQQAYGLCTDTRTVSSDNAFLALSGGNFDGHAFLAKAVEAGASILIVSKYVDIPGQSSIVRVKDCLKALGDLARAHRRRWARAARRRGFESKIVAITGSAGKTTTCRAVASLLSATSKGKVHSAAGNLNNAIGIPMVLLGLTEEHGIGVVEIGTNSRGEVEEGVRIAEPEVGILTLVAGAHGEGIGSLEDIAWEKGAIFAGLGTHGIAVVNADDPRAMAQVLRSEARALISYGFSEKADLRITSRKTIGTEGQNLAFQIEMPNVAQHFSVKVPLLGDAGAYAASAAFACGLAVHQDNLDFPAAMHGLEAIAIEDGRLRPKTLRSGMMIIDDCYNANPASTLASIKAAKEIAESLNRSLVLVLGEMRELGESTIREHERVGTDAARSGAIRLIAVTGAAKHLANAAKELGLRTDYFETSQKAAEFAKQSLGSNQLVLIKGSRGVALEAVVIALESAGELARA